MSAVLDEVITTAQLVPLSQAVDVNPKIDRTALHDDLDVSFVPMAAVEALSGGIDVSTVRKYGEVKKGYTHFRDGDILFAKVTPCMENGKMAIARKLINGLGFGSTEFHVLRPRAGVDARYIYYFVSSQTFRKEASGHMTGAVGLRRVPSAYLEEQLITLPGIEQQREIVAEIEKQFSRLDEAVTNLQRVKANLKRYKASVLKDAVEGRLVPTEAELARREGRSFETGEQLLQRVLVDRRKHWLGQGKYKDPHVIADQDLPTLPDSWTWISVDALAFVTKLAGFEYTKFVKYDDSGDLAVIKAENAGGEGFRRTAFSKVKSESVSLLTRSRLIAGDLLMVFVGAGTGKVACVPDDQPYFLGPNISMIRVDEDHACPQYIEHYLRSPQGHSLALGFTKAVAQPSLSMGTIRCIPVALPPRAEQVRIAAEVDRRMSLVRSVEAEVDANLKRAQALRQATLSKQFRM